MKQGDSTTSNARVRVRFGDKIEQTRTGDAVFLSEHEWRQAQLG